MVVLFHTSTDNKLFMLCLARLAMDGMRLPDAVSQRILRGISQVNNGAGLPILISFDQLVRIVVSTSDCSWKFQMFVFKFVSTMYFG